LRARIARRRRRTRSPRRGERDQRLEGRGAPLRRGDPPASDLRAAAHPRRRARPSPSSCSSRLRYCAAPCGATAASSPDCSSTPRRRGRLGLRRLVLTIAAMDRRYGEPRRDPRGARGRHLGRRDHRPSPWGVLIVTSSSGARAGRRLSSAACCPAMFLETSSSPRRVRARAAALPWSSRRSGTRQTGPDTWLVPPRPDRTRRVRPRAEGRDRVEQYRVTFSIHSFAEESLTSRRAESRSSVQSCSASRPRSSSALWALQVLYGTKYVKPGVGAVVPRRAAPGAARDDPRPARQRTRAERRPQMGDPALGRRPAAKTQREVRRAGSGGRARRECAAVTRLRAGSSSGAADLLKPVIVRDGGKPALVNYLYEHRAGLRFPA